jgi:glutamyl-tRNA synthetase
MNALRLVVVGALRGPHIFDIITWIGREETLRRIDKGIEIIGKIKE